MNDLEVWQTALRAIEDMAGFALLAVFIGVALTVFEHAVRFGFKKRG